MTWPEIWYGKSLGAKTLRILLTPASWLYDMGWSGYRALYDLGLKKSTAPYAPILVIGNLTVGGSGKTPVTVFVAQVLRELGHSVVISASGYGGRRSAGASLAPEGNLDPSEWGDEPALLRLLLPDVPLIVGRARVKAAELMRDLAIDRPGAVLLLDDGFQHLPLRKTGAIVIDPLSDNTACLPAGPYREARRNLARADMVIGERSEFRVESAPLGFERLDELGSGKYHDMSGRGADVLCAVGRPQAFVESLREQGVHTRVVEALPDHATFHASHLDRLRGPIIVTAKDAVKLSSMPETQGKDIYVARHSVTVQPADLFRKRLVEIISTL